VPEYLISKKEPCVTKKIFVSSVLLSCLLIISSGQASAKACYLCGKDSALLLIGKYVWTDKDTEISRNNAEKLGCRIEKTVGDCKEKDRAMKVAYERTELKMKLPVFNFKTEPGTKETVIKEAGTKEAGTKAPLKHNNPFKKK
jgi:hypothetical protein